uniref:Probable arginine--tRNA ligase, mitochondrial n=1 Tax=Clastoptera arizonana TaxID=38151 RepID=A0A1B6CFH1_9HEMI
MVANIKNFLGNKILELVKSNEHLPNLDFKFIFSLLKLGRITTEKEVNFHLNVQPLIKAKYSLNSIISKFNLKNDTIINSVCEEVNQEKKSIITIKINCDYFINEVLQNNDYFENLLNPKLSNGDKIIVDFSSPNIAKPFHVGHLRSTIIGNFISNLYSFFSYDTTRLTYIGDWGTQFGLLNIGLNKLNLSDDDLKQNPIELLYKAYVEGNRLSQSDSSIADEARRVFQCLETGEQTYELQRWKRFKEFTAKELARTYDRLGIKFDVYNWESMYTAKNILPLIKQMQDRGLLSNEDGKLVVKLDSGRSATLLKSDGATLYLTRDIAAALDRYKSYNCKHMLYVVDNSQTEHFIALKDILSAMEFNWAKNIQHIKFGRVKGMSTRKGQVVFMKDILDEAKERMHQKQIESPNILGISAVVVNDLKQKRLKDYEFNWDIALQIDGDTGIKLQYTHCRLTSLEKNCGVSLPNHCDPKLLQEPEALLLIQEIARFDDILLNSFNNLEACTLVKYLFQLCNATSRALKVLKIKHETRDIGAQRLLLFNRSKIVLYRGMKILGLQPLEEM